MSKKNIGKLRLGSTLEESDNELPTITEEIESFQIEEEPKTSKQQYPTEEKTDPAAAKNQPGSKIDLEKIEALKKRGFIRFNPK